MLEALRRCDLGYISRSRGRRAALKLLMPRWAMRGRGSYSIRPFIETNSIFVHVPKAAGVSIATSLYGSLAGGHLRLEEYRRLFRPEAIESMFVFTVVRNPFDRIFSAYNFLMQNGMSAGDRDFCANVLAPCRSFEHFVMDFLGRDEIQQHVHFIPQAHFIEGRNGLAQVLDFVGRFETLRDDFELIRKHVQPGARLSHSNRTRGTAPEDYRSAYTPAMIDIVAELYGPSMRLLGYDFEGWSDEPIARYRGHVREQSATAH